MDAFRFDLRVALRGFRRQKNLIFSAIAALALGIGATTTMFSIVHGGTRNLPFEDADELVAIVNTRPRQGIKDLPTSTSDFQVWSRQQTSFEGLAAFRDHSFNLSGGGRPERRPGASITANAFQLLGGVTPILGRALVPADAAPGAPAVVLLSYELWQARYGGDVDMVGQTIRVDGAPRTVIGVMPRGFGFPINARLWLPLGTDGASTAERIRVFGRLRDDVDLEQARTELAVIARRLERGDPVNHTDLATHVFPFVELETEPEIKAFLYLMLGAVSFVLLIACANVANLLLARAATHARDTAIRTSLGATRSRIITQHLGESLLIALAGGTLGLITAHFSVQFFGRATAHILDVFWMQFRVDPVVFAFSAAITGVAAIVAGSAPALQAARTLPGAVLKSESHAVSSLRLSRLSRGLVVAQVALACGLLAMASIFVQGALRLRAVDFPFSTRDVFTATVAFRSDPAGASSRAAAHHRAVLERIAAVPGIQAAAFISALPGRGAGQTAFARESEVDLPLPELPSAALVVATPGFLAVLQSEVIAGRDLNQSDDSHAPGAMLVNQSWIRRFSPDREPLGRRVRVMRRDYTIVGVVPDLMIQDVQDRDGAGMYIAAAQAPFRADRLVARVSGNPSSFAPAIRDAIESYDPDLPLVEPGSLYDAIYTDKKVLEVFGILFAAFGAGALLLTVTGLYGVVSFAVSRRTRELGIRMALGANRRTIVRMIIRQGAGQLGLGFLIGGSLAYALGRAAASTQEFLKTVDPRAFAVVILALTITGLLALYSPARRAARVQPLDALRHE